MHLFQFDLDHPINQNKYKESSAQSKCNLHHNQMYSQNLENSDIGCSLGFPSYSDSSSN